MADKANGLDDYKPASQLAKELGDKVHKINLDRIIKDRLAFNDDWLKEQIKSMIVKIRIDECEWWKNTQHFGLSTPVVDERLKELKK